MTNLVNSINGTKRVQLDEINREEQPLKKLRLEEAILFPSLNDERADLQGRVQLDVRKTFDDWIESGKTLSRSGDPDSLKRADDEFNEALKYSSSPAQRVEAVYLLTQNAVLLGSAEDLEAAIAALERAFQQRRYQSEGEYYLRIQGVFYAWLSEKNGDLHALEESAAAYKRSLLCNEDNQIKLNTLVRLGSTYSNLTYKLNIKYLHDSIDSYEQALKCNPDPQMRADILHKLTYLYMQTGNSVEKVLSASEEGGLLFQALGNLNSAVELYGMALRCKPGPSTKDLIYFNICSAYLQKSSNGDFIGAAALLINLPIEEKLEILAAIEKITLTKIGQIQNNLSPILSNGI